ncbi:MAG: hypothetical protein QOH89_67, partial [Pseudonocardiales bacterium]|nr:hypothetical protein [Pseudonocardiales bacterium]
MNSYAAADREREVVEPAKRAGAEPQATERSDFARDRARV